MIATQERTLTRDDVLNELAPVSNVDVRTITVDPRTGVVLGEDEVAIRPGNRQRSITIDPDNGIADLYRHIGLSQSTALKLQPKTFETVATELFARGGDTNVLVRDGRIVKFGVDMSNNRVTIGRLVQTLDRQIEGCEYTRAMVMGADTALIDIAGHRSEAVIPNDIVRAGVSIIFSPIGSVKPVVKSYALRQWCMNGATTNHVLSEFTGAEGDDVWQFFRKSIRQAIRSFAKIVEVYQRMAGEEIADEDRAAMVEAVLVEAGIRGRLADAVRARALEAPPRTSWDVYNLGTWASTHLIEEPRQLVRARRATEHYASTTEHARVCPMCHSNVRSSH